jgi:hypothetical protein
MPHDIRVISAKEFLRADVRGEPDLATSKRILEELAAAGGADPGRDILLDVRQTGAPVLTSVDLFELVQVFRKLGLGVLNRIAILRLVKDEFDRARFFEMLATDRGLNVTVFDDFESACEWLHGEGQPAVPAPPEE